MKKDILKSVKSTATKVGVKVKKRSPEILIVAGIIGTVASTVMACKATTKVGKIIDDTKNDIAEVHEAVETGVTKANESYSKDDSRKDLTIIYAQTGVKLVKLYAPSVIVGAVSITGIVASHNILRKRNAAIAAAYVTMDKTFKEYRGRVVERYGANVDKELRYNIKAKKYEGTVTDPESGKEKKVKSNVGIANPTTNDYVRWFDETCDNYEENMDYNLLYLHSQQEFANERLKADGFLFLSDVYEALGITRTKMSQTVGWIYKPGNEAGDNYVDFGVIVTNRETEDGGYEEAILMEFNVDGPILDLI